MNFNWPSTSSALIVKIIRLPSWTAAKLLGSIAQAMRIDDG